MSNSQVLSISQRAIIGLTLLLVTFLLYVLSRYNYLLFHGIVEIYSIIIAAGIFIVAWNTRKFSDSNGLVFLGIAYLSVAMIDFLHTFSYVGTGTFPDYPYFANQLWILARLVESCSIALYVSLKWDRVQIPVAISFMVYGIITLTGTLSILVFRVFPTAFIDGQGQTPFKIFSGYIVIGILILSLSSMYRQRHRYDPTLYRYLTISIVLTMLSELAFTLYSDNYGVTNVIGHILKIISFYLIYRSVIVNVLQRPYELLFVDLSNSEKSLRQAVETKDRFFNIIAHDLRSPFNIIINLSEILTQLGERSKDPEVIEYTKHIHETSLHTFRLLENLLTWAQVQTNKISFQPQWINVSDIIDDTLQLTQLSAKAKGIIIHRPEGPEIYAMCDSDMIRTVVRNLLSNAIKFTRGSGIISVHTFFLADNKSWVFQVQDNGIGMSPELQAGLFSVGRNTSRSGTANEKGTGLGLILCKEFVEMHYGRLEIISTQGSGCTVICHFPGLKNDHLQDS